MKKIKWTWKKILSLAAGTLGIGTLVSCYGMPMGPLFMPEIFGTVKSSKGEPIPGIAVKYLDKTVQTHTDGTFIFELAGDTIPDSVELSFKDVDGEENGSYEDLTICVPLTYNIDITLNEKE